MGLNNIFLKHTEDYVDIFLPINTTLYDIEGAKLIINYQNSNRIKENISQLILFLNDIPICQRTLSIKLPGGKFTCIIPTNIIKSGYNKLTIKTSLHYNEECEIPNMDFLWLSIDTEKSYFVFNLKRNKEKFTNENLFKIFDYKNIIVPKTNFIVEKNYYKEANLLVSKIANKRKFKDTFITYETKPKENYINFIIGTKDFVKQYKKIDNNISFIEEDNTYFVIISGQNKQEVKKNILNIILNDEKKKGNTIKLKKFKRNIIKDETIINFSELGLGLGNLKLTGLSPKEKGIYFKIAPELFLSPNKYTIFTLHMGYSAGLREDSSLHIMLNSRLVESIPLNNPKGQIFKDYKLYLPMSLFKRGTNYLSFKAYLKPLKAEKCAPIIEESFRLDIYEDSTIEIPKLDIWHILPDLYNFFDTGFPYTYWLENNKKVSIILSSQTYILSAFILTYYLSQQINNIIPFNIETKQNFNEHFIYIGNPYTLKPNIFQKITILQYLKKISLKNKAIITQQIINENPFKEGTFIFIQKPEDIKKVIEVAKHKKIKGDSTIINLKTGEVINFNINNQYYIGKKPLETKLNKKLFENLRLYILFFVLFSIIIALLIWKLTCRRKIKREQ